LFVGCYLHILIIRISGKLKLWISWCSLLCL